MNEERIGRDLAGRVCLFTMVSLVALAAPVLAGISMSGGAGLFVAADEDVYADIQTDLYPEIGGDLEFSMVRLGLKAGLIYRNVEVWGSYWGGDYSYSYYDEYTLAFIPVQAELLIAPLDAGDELPTFSPYFGGMVGAFVAIGDNSDHIPAISVKAGADFNVEPLFIYGDLRYTLAEKDGVDYGGVMAVVGMGLRFGK